MHFSLDRMLEWTPYILEGLKVIIVLSLVCALIGVVTGTHLGTSPCVNYTIIQVITKKVKPFVQI